MITLLLASSLLLATSPAEDAPRRQVKVIVTSPDVEVRPGLPTFRATEILEVQFAAQFRQRPTGDHLVEFKVYTPTGALYQTLTVPFTGQDRARQLRPVEGYPAALLERRIRQTEQLKYYVFARLPVAGTWIVTNSLYGGWRVDAHFDGSLEPTAHAAFSIQP